MPFAAALAVPCCALTQPALGYGAAWGAIAGWPSPTRLRTGIGAVPALRGPSSAERHHVLAGGDNRLLLDPVPDLLNFGMEP